MINTKKHTGIAFIFFAIHAQAMAAEYITDRERADAQFQELCREVGDCNQPTPVQTRTEVVVVPVPVPVAAPAQIQVPASTQTPPAPAPITAPTISQPEVADFENGFVQIHWLGVSASPDGRRIIARMEIKNKLAESLKLSINSGNKDHYVTDKNANIWTLANSSGIEFDNYPNTHLTASSLTRAQLVFENSPKGTYDGGQNSKQDIAWPVSLSSEIIFSSRDHAMERFGFGFENIAPKQ